MLSNAIDPVASPGARMNRILVVGGAGTVGSWIVRLLLAAGRSVSALDRVRGASLEETESLPVLEYIVADIMEPDALVRQLLAETDVLILALPSEIALALLNVLPGRLKDTCLLIDTLSTKMAFGAALRQRLPKLPAAGINPLFRPSSNKMCGGVAWVPYADSVEAAELEGLLTSQGLHMLRMTPAEHDETMATVQSLVHILVLAFGSTLFQSNIKLADQLSPPFLCISALLARVVSGEPHVYWEIQKENPFSEGIRSQLSKALSELDRMIKSDDIDGYSRIFQQLRSSKVLDMPASERNAHALFGALSQMPSASCDESASRGRESA